MKMKIIATHCILFVLHAQTTVVFAVEVAPRITDREIIERLTRLEEGQAALLREMNQRFDEMNRSIDQRFESVNQRFDGMNLSINQRFESMDKRLDGGQSHVCDHRGYFRAYRLCGLGPSQRYQARAAGHRPVVSGDEEAGGERPKDRRGASFGWAVVTLAHARKFIDG